MLELIFRGGLEWGYGLILECWEYFSVILMDIMSMDFAYLREHMPVLNSIQQIVLTLAGPFCWGIWCSRQQKPCSPVLVLKARIRSFSLSEPSFLRFYCWPVHRSVSSA